MPTLLSDVGDGGDTRSDKATAKYYERQPEWRGRALMKSEVSRCRDLVMMYLLRNGFTSEHVSQIMSGSISERRVRDRMTRMVDAFHDEGFSLGVIP